MVELVEPDDSLTCRYVCEQCGSAYVHKVDAISCEESCEKEISFDPEEETRDSPTKSWTDHELGEEEI